MTAKMHPFWWFRPPGIFGYTYTGDTILTLSWSMFERIAGSVFTITENGTANSITVALRGYRPVTAKVKCAIYRHADLALIGQTEERTLNLTMAVKWYTFNFSAPKPPLTQNTAYLLMVWADYTTEDIEGRCTYYAPDSLHYVNTHYDGFPDPLPTPEHGVWVVSIYCIYAKG